MIKDWFLNSEVSEGKESSWNDDEVFFSWKDDATNYEKKLQDLRVHKLSLQLGNLGDSTTDLRALPQALRALLEKVNRFTPNTQS